MERLKSHHDFVTVLKHRKKVTDSDIVVHFMVRDGFRYVDTASQSHSPIGDHRLGLAVSKGVGNAVVRNRVKRRFRVLARRYEGRLPNHCDIVMRARPSAARADFSSLDRQVCRLFAAVDRKVAAGRHDHGSDRSQPIDHTDSRSRPSAGSHGTVCSQQHDADGNESDQQA